MLENWNALDNLVLYAVGTVLSILIFVGSVVSEGYREIDKSRED